MFTNSFNFYLCFIIMFPAKILKIQNLLITFYINLFLLSIELIAFSNYCYLAPTINFLIKEMLFIKKLTRVSIMDFKKAELKWLQI